MAEDVTAVPGYGSDTRLRVMLLTEKLGNYVSLQYQIDRYGDSLSECGDPALRDAFDQLRQRSVDPIEFERVHGAGSLLDRAHPSNLSLIRRGVFRIPDAQL